MKTLDIEKLNELYRDAEAADKDVFAEFKSNVLLCSGMHYSKASGSTTDRDGANSGQSKQKVRITKNLMPKITGKIIDGIMGLAPDLKVYPANPSETQDKKSAELYESVRQYGVKRYKLDQKKEDWCADFVEISEVAVKIYWDPTKGDLRSYEQKVNELGPLFKAPDGSETNEPVTSVIDETSGSILNETPHEPIPDKERPHFSGDFVFETIFPADLLRCPEAESIEESPYLIVRKMMDKEKAKRLVPEEDPDRDDKLSFIQRSSEEKFKVFDQNTHSFKDSDGRCLIREFYYRPCYDYPEGKYIICTEFGILTEGTLPFGVFPIAWRAYKKIQTKARGTGVVKVARPWQVELNRASSTQIQHQLVHGDDKVILPPGGKMTQESTLPGLRQFKAIGAPTIIPGRTGDQFTPYIESTKEELFFAISEDTVEEGQGQSDPVALLYRAFKRNQKYGRPANEFRSFYEEVLWIYLRLAKEYFDDERVIRAAGRRERVNLQEFKGVDPLDVRIDLIESNGDAETTFGRYLAYQSVLQYVGKDLPKEAVGKILNNLPFADKEVFSQLSQSSRNIENDILALERGEPRQAEPDDDHKLYIFELTSKIKSPDFRYLAPEIQQNYIAKRDQHRAFEAQALEQLRMAEQQMIPMDGNLVKVDQYTMEDGKQVRMTLPSKAIEWLKAKLDQQGMTQERLGGLAQADQVAIGQQMLQSMPPQPNPMMDQGMMNQQPLQGEESGYQY